MAKKALIAMSGGVDSSVAAYLMKEAGYDCIGVTMKLYDNEDIGMEREKTCCSLSDIEDARKMCIRDRSIPFCPEKQELGKNESQVPMVRIP